MSRLRASYAWVLTLRIQKFLANAGVASRRACEQLVTEGRVTVNGRVVRVLPLLVEPETDDIRVDGQRIRPEGVTRRRGEPRYIYIMLNKPTGVVSSNLAQATAGRPQTRAIDLLPPALRRRVYPVGRLDASSRGLLLLTDDGDLTHRLTHPSYGVTKTYRVVCDGDVSPPTIQKLQEGVFLADRESGTASRTAPARIKIVRRGRTQSTLEMTISEGRNRQVRRMLAALGHKVRDLKRTRLGPLKLEKLPEASSRLLTPAEVAALRKAVEKQPETKGQVKRQRA